MSKDVAMKCPGCGAIVRGKTGWFRKSFFCDNCHREINPAADALEAVSCANCGNVVMFDTRTGRKSLCPICNQPLMEHSIADIDVECPFCHIQQRVKFNETRHTCPICNQEFDVQQAKNMQAAADAASATMISVPAGNQHIIWKHPLTRFAFASQVVVPEGYTGLILRDGVCSAPSQPGRYVLSDTIRSMTEQLEYSLLDQAAQISVQILFVRKQIDKQFNWTGAKQTITDPRTGDSLGMIGFGGSAAVEVIDARKLAEFAGYENVTADELIAAGSGDAKGSRLYEKICSCCFENTHQFLMSAVYSNGYAPKVLDANKLFFQNQIRPAIDDQLAEIGLKTSLFSLDFITFQEDDAVVSTRAQAEREKENRKEIRRLAELLLDWEAPQIPLHMKDDQTLSAELVYAGSMKFRILEEEKFFRNTQVQHWVTEGFTEAEIREYFSRLAKLGSSTVLSDHMQQMVNDTNADIRDLNTYYHYIREKIRDNLSAYFAKDGLEVELFDMHQKSCHMSQALEVMTSGQDRVSIERINSTTRVNMESTRAGEHKTMENIHMDTYAFDSGIRTQKMNVDSNERITKDTISVNEDRAMTENYGEKNANYVNRAGFDNRTQNALESMERENELRHKAEYRQDEQDDRGYLHYVEESETDWQRDQARKKEAYLHETEMTGYAYQSEASASKSSIKIQEINQETAVHGAQHNQAQQDIYAETQERQALHYLNQQEIENRAQEIRTEWETRRRMDEEMLDHQLKSSRRQWEESLTRSRESASLKQELEQGVAQNERIVNDIMIKIAESNLDLKQKKDAYERLLRNQDADDSLRHAVDQAQASIHINYESEHLRNILTQEEMDYMAGMAERSADFEEKLADQRTAREEALKNADFIREMKRREADTAHAMELLKIQFERDERQALRDHEIRLKDIEITELKSQLAHFEQMGEQDIRKTGIQAHSETTVRTAEIGAWADVETTRARAESESHQAEKKYEAVATAAGYAYASEQARSERQYREAREREKQASEERLAQARMKMESDYMERADKLLTQLLAIQASMKKMEGENERTAIEKGADVQIAWAQANAEAAKHQQDSNVTRIIQETEKLLEELQKARRALEEARKASKKDKKRGHYSGNNNGNPRGGYGGNGGWYGNPAGVPPVSGPNGAPGYNGTPGNGGGYGYNGTKGYGASSNASGNQGYSTTGQPGTRICPKCGRAYPAYATICTCGNRLV